VYKREGKDKHSGRGAPHGRHEETVTQSRWREVGVKEGEYGAGLFTHRALLGQQAGPHLYHKYSYPTVIVYVSLMCISIKE
jgi:hypothetical protein